MKRIKEEKEDMIQHEGSQCSITCDKVDVEHEISYQRHITALKAEFKKGLRASKISVAELMETIYKQRRKAMLSTPQHAYQTIIEFPFLAEYDQVGGLFDVLSVKYYI